MRCRGEATWRALRGAAAWHPAAEPSAGARSRCRAASLSLVLLRPLLHARYPAPEPPATPPAAPLTTLACCVSICLPCLDHRVRSCASCQRSGQDRAGRGSQRRSARGTGSAGTTPVPGMAPPLIGQASLRRWPVHCGSVAIREPSSGMRRPSDPAAGALPLAHLLLQRAVQGHLLQRAVALARHCVAVLTARVHLSRELLHFAPGRLGAARVGE
jgi:hypothetical protein